MHSAFENGNEVQELKRVLLERRCQMVIEIVSRGAWRLPRVRVWPGTVRSGQAGLENTEEQK